MQIFCKKNVSFVVKFLHFMFYVSEYIYFIHKSSTKYIR